MRPAMTDTAPDTAMPAEIASLVERLAQRAATMNGAVVGASDGATYTLGYYDQFAAADDKEAAAALTAAYAQLAAKNAALERERRRATDAEYFNIAYRNMLGPVGRKVAEMWREKGVTRVHFAWGPDADNLTGEERAQIILDHAARAALKAAMEAGR